MIPLASLRPAISRLIARAEAEVGRAELLTAAGFGAVVYGIAQFSAPAAWIAGGLVLLALGVAGALPKQRT